MSLKGEDDRDDLGDFEGARNESWLGEGERDFSEGFFVTVRYSELGEGERRFLEAFCVMASEFGAGDAERELREDFTLGGRSVPPNLETVFSGEGEGLLDLALGPLGTIRNCLLDLLEEILRFSGDSLLEPGDDRWIGGFLPGVLSPEACLPGVLSPEERCGI